MLVIMLQPELAVVVFVACLDHLKCSTIVMSPTAIKGTT